ncbi:MAG: hypothetical protein R3C58_02585 [Parvularculaceae bacterium]
MTFRHLSDSDFIDTDLIAPVQIEHRSEEIGAEGIPNQKYNYLVYYFERDGHCIRARSYLNAIAEASIYGPFESNSADSAPIDDPEFVELVLTYLKRRYSEIKALSRNEASGYQTIWRAGV